MNDEWSQVAANAIAHEARMASAAIHSAFAGHGAPSAIYRPALSIDGNQWCALYGDNIQDGVAGFGDSPALAMADFDKAWCAKLANVPSQPRPVVATQSEFPGAA